MEVIVNKAKGSSCIPPTQCPTNLMIQMIECFLISGSLDFENQTQLSPRFMVTGDHGLPHSSSSSAATVCDGSMKFETPRRGRCFEGIDQMEAEFEAELQRLQFHQMQRRLVFDDLSVSSGEVIDPVLDPRGAVAVASPCGVHPHELERKLHELLEARQREQIKELEDALEGEKEVDQISLLE